MLERLLREGQDGNPTFSLEIFPPRTEHARNRLQERVERLAALRPAMVAVTTAGGRAEHTLQLCGELARFAGVHVLMHISCSGLARARLVSLLADARENGVHSILAIRGDTSPAKHAELTRSVEIVRIAREEFGDTFKIGVGAYPEGLWTGDPVEGETLEQNRARHIQYLLEKVEAGADFAITQAFFDAKVFIDFVTDCRAAGIPDSFPIVPGVMPVQSLESLVKLSKHINANIPQRIMDQLEAVKADKTAVLQKGIEIVGNLCEEVLKSGMARSIHFYTFNLEFAVRKIVEDQLKISSKQILPWKPSAHPKRMEEDVRPIFWANRPKSYLRRTEDWDQFPCGRWEGLVSGSESFARLPDEDLFSRDTFFQRNDIKRKAWGEAPLTETEIFEVFAGFIEGRIPFLPWCEESLHLETSIIRDKLVALNRSGYVTINSQPRINAAPSGDPKFGWGPDGGYVYQKAYVEFFTSAKKLRKLMDCLEEPQFAERSLVYHAVDHKGNTYSNAKEMKPCAVTWGVFPGKEVIQPTVVDPDTFLVWKDEAFALWVRGWASIYEDDTPSYELLHDMHDKYFLVNIVDNDFIDGDIFDLFDKLICQ